MLSYCFRTLQAGALGKYYYEYLASRNLATMRIGRSKKTSLGYQAGGLWSNDLVLLTQAKVQEPVGGNYLY